MGIRKLDDPPASYSQTYFQSIIGKINQNLANIQQTTSPSTVTTSGGIAVTEGVWYSGAGVPPTNIGAVGDFYLDTSTYVIYGPKTSAGWGSGITINAPGGGGGGSASSSGFTFTIPGLLAIDAPAAPLLYSANMAQSFTSIVSVLELVPSAGSVSYTIEVAGTTWATVSTSAQVTTTAAPALQVAANSLLELDITGVGTGLFAGSGLTVIVR